MANLGLKCDKQNWKCQQELSNTMYSNQTLRSNPDSVSYIPGNGLLVGSCYGVAASSAGVESALRFGLPIEQGARLPTVHLFPNPVVETAPPRPKFQPRMDWVHR